ncbi:jg7296, partial [Pararge aegeria aegeria]
MVPKPGKSPQETSSYRPISLLPVVGKLFERIGLNRLLPYLQEIIPTHEIRIRQCEVLKVLRNLDVNKASGPDGIPAVVLKTCAPELSPILTRLYRLSLKTTQVPKAWKIANVQPVPKKGSRADPSNYRPIAITSLLCKSLERVLNNRLLAYLENNELLSDRQYGFRRNRSTGDLLVYATHIWGEAMDKHGEALAVSLDVSKAFDRVWHESLLHKLPAYGLPISFYTNLVQFNASKTQACLFSAKRSPFPLTPTFRNVSVPITNSIELLGISISSNLSFGQCIESKAKTAGKKLGIRNKVKRYFTP